MTFYRNPALPKPCPRCSALLAKVDLKVGNRDGEAYAVKTTEGKCFLVLDADTYHNDEVFCGMGSTEQVKISEAAFAALANEPSSATCGTEAPDVR